MTNEKNRLRDRKKREQELKVDEILKAAKSVFDSKGFLRTTMDEIAYEASLSKPTIYRFFPTKEDLYFSLLIPEMSDCLCRMAKINTNLKGGRYSSGAPLVRDVINVFFDKYKSDPDIFRIGQLYQQSGMVWALDKKTGDALRDIARNIMNEMRGLFDNAVSAGIVRDIDRFMLVDIMIGSLFGIVQLQDSKSRGRGDRVQMDSVIEMSVRLLIDSVVPKNK